jgi:hypothetical protein
VRTENCAAGFKTGDKISAATRVRGGLEMQTVLPIRVAGDAWVNETTGKGMSRKDGLRAPVGDPLGPLPCPIEASATLACYFRNTSIRDAAQVSNA